MNSKNWMLLLPLLVLGAVSAMAAESKPAKPTAPTDAKNGRVCFSEPTVGSHLPKRVCMTEAERERRRQADQETMGRLQNSTSGRTRTADK